MLASLKLFGDWLDNFDSKSGGTGVMKWLQVRDLQGMKGRFSIWHSVAVVITDVFREGKSN